MLSLLHTLAANDIHLALATSSHAVNFLLKSTHLGRLFSFFPPRNRVLGDDARIPPGQGKPAPDIYLLALETINAEIRARGNSDEREIEPDECLVFEDSVPGVEAGRRAGMRVVWCPHPELLKEYAGREKEVLAGITAKHQPDIVRDVLEEVGAEGRVKGRSLGRVDDGWGELLKTLTDFPYARYGIGA